MFTTMLKGMFLGQFDPRLNDRWFSMDLMIYVVVYDHAKFECGKWRATVTATTLLLCGVPLTVACHFWHCRFSGSCMWTQMWKIAYHIQDITYSGCNQSGFQEYDILRQLWLKVNDFCTGSFSKQSHIPLGEWICRFWGGINPESIHINLGLIEGPKLFAPLHRVHTYPESFR